MKKVVCVKYIIIVHKYEQIVVSFFDTAEAGPGKPNPGFLDYPRSEGVVYSLYLRRGAIIH
jgi:hypothetical protein